MVASMVAVVASIVVFNYLGVVSFRTAIVFDAFYYLEFPQSLRRVDCLIIAFRAVVIFDGFLWLKFTQSSQGVEFLIFWLLAAAVVVFGWICDCVIY